VEENLEEKEFAKGLLRMSLEVEWETRGDLRIRLTSSIQRVLLLCTGVVKLGVGKSSAVLDLRQGTASGERGVTRSFPSCPRQGEENSTGTLPKFRKRETAETCLSGNCGGEKGDPTEGYGGLPGSMMYTSSSEAFPFLSTASGYASGIARGSCG
jgi:hypothetical protein